MADKNKNNYLWIGIAVVAVVILAIVLISNLNNNSDNNSQKESLTSNDFRIVSASWKETLSWEKMCAGEFGDSLSAGYLLDVQMNEDYLTCSIVINGVNKNTFGIDKTNVIEGTTNVDYTKDNQITLCCTSNNKEGEICDSIALKAKC